MSAPPPPPGAPPPAPETTDDHASWNDSHGSNFHMEETPLIGSRKTSAINHHHNGNSSSQRRPSKQVHTHYSAIHESPADDENDSYNNDDDDNKSISSVTSLTSLGSITTVAENFREGLTIPFTDSEGSPEKVVWGLSSLCVVGTFIGLVMPKEMFPAGRWYPYWGYISSVIGYNYLVLWSICFYPQVLLNYRRKSTKGLSNDFAILNLMGWSFYSAYVGSMYFDKEIKQMYVERFGAGESTVESNDVMFSFHAMILAAIYVFQIIYYSGQKLKFKLKPQTWFLILGMGLPSLIMPILISSRILSYKHWLDYFYMLSYFKICCTLTKYTKQAWLNYSRKSTKGWNIWYNFLECAGGTLSMLQVVLDSIDMNNMAGITGNLAKFFLGMATLFFDGIFFTQHYVLYPSHGEESDDEEGQDTAASKASVKHVRSGSRFIIPEINMHIPEEIGTGGFSEELVLTDSLRSGDDL